ncbi:protein tweety homolog 2-like isoform X1 [Notothenia coriiceps]|uniref:Protein tweety homolog 2-like isoform X1 n=1 Tax=Notothenia coriiceps TaxID=8208 RepID=A0A6I9PF13_9TELE|nr:PREDICTED: protein tweety homolog 2-like isoform X1 [Notothenia coriiceps]
MMGWRDCSTSPFTPSSLRWPSLPSSALCPAPGGASPVNQRSMKTRTARVRTPSPPIRTPNVSSNGNPGYESLPLTDRQSPPPSYSPSMLTGYGGGQSHPNPAHSRNLYSR